MIRHNDDIVQCACRLCPPSVRNHKSDDLNQFRACDDDVNAASAATAATITTTKKRHSVVLVEYLTRQTEKWGSRCWPAAVAHRHNHMFCFVFGPLKSIDSVIYYSIYIFLAIEIYDIYFI